MTTTTQSSFAIFAAACRENTGSHMLDSGGAYGRHWQRPPITRDTPPVTLKVFGRGSGKCDDRDPGVTATISLPHWLDEGFTIDEELTDKWNTFLATDPDDSWFELGRQFMEANSFHQHVRDNVCNGENDFSQVFVWEVWTPQEEESDWVYADDAVCVLYLHTGCDVRGGYGHPLFLRSTNYEYAMQLEFMAQFFAESGTQPGDLDVPLPDDSLFPGHPIRTASDVELTDDELRKIDETWQCGYSSNPAASFSDDVERIIHFDETKPDRITVLLRTGETVNVVAVMPYLQ